MTLTREKLLELGKPRCQEVSINGMGSVWLRSMSEFKRSQRDAVLWNDNGELIPQFRERMRAYAIIDQAMENENEPMFSEADLQTVLDLDHSVTRPLFQAIKEFNGEDDTKKKGGASSDSSESSDETTV